jgi:hypothetical protein
MATGGGRCALPGLFVERGGGAGLPVRGVGLPDGGLVRLVEPGVMLRIAKALGGGDRLRLGVGEITWAMGDMTTGDAGTPDRGERMAAAEREGAKGSWEEIDVLGPGVARGVASGERKRGVIGPGVSGEMRRPRGIADVGVISRRAELGKGDGMDAERRVNDVGEVTGSFGFSTRRSFNRKVKSRPYSCRSCSTENQTQGYF